jgi:hypothetical protein
LTPIDLFLGPLAAEGFIVNRSGVQWLCEDGHLCRPNEVVAYCNISLEPVSGSRPGKSPFAAERELQAALAPRVAGRLRIGSGTSLGGHLDTLKAYPWDAETVIGRLQPVEAADVDEDAGRLRLLMLAGRRATGLADVLLGLLPGWHSRTRGWWSDDGAPAPTLLNLGICDTSGSVGGDHGAFFELFEQAAGPGQIVVVPNHPVAPCAPCLFEQFTRTPADTQAIAADLTRALSDATSPPSADDWLFAGSFLAAMENSPIRETYELLTPGGLRQGGPPAAVLLSLNAEGGTIMRHKALGYHLHLLPFHRDAAGPAVQAWLGQAFEPVKRSVDDIRRDYIRLIDTVGAATGARFLILNRMSSSGREDICSYLPFDAPLGATLANVASKELNLMLHDLEAERDVSIIDADAIAAELGGAANLPDGVHQSGAMQAVVRSEILAALG